MTEPEQPCVYVVFETGHDGGWIHAIFTNETAARQHQRWINNKRKYASPDVERWPLQDTFQPPTNPSDVYLGGQSELLPDQHIVDAEPTLRELP